MKLGIYISIPFCRSKCSFCNFASGVFPPKRMEAYGEAVRRDLTNSSQIAERLGGKLTTADSIYLGGGTPSLLAPEQVHTLFDKIKQNFDLEPKAEITVECAPNSISDATLDAMLVVGVNRISFGAQSFVDRETSSVARLHKAKDTVRDIERIRRAGIDNVSVDLIAGLPHQTPESWDHSLSQLIELDVPHVSVYMLEIDEDSRLGYELIAGGTRYHAHHVPDEEQVVRMYEQAIERLARAGVDQYEISNFARPGYESRHNLKYWTREPYFGFGADAHSMLAAQSAQSCDIRFATPEELSDFERTQDHYAGPVQRLNNAEALEEAMIVGLRLNRGVDLENLHHRYGIDPVVVFAEVLDELTNAELLTMANGNAKLTDPGRLLSNEVFERLLGAATPATR